MVQTDRERERGQAGAKRLSHGANVIIGTYLLSVVGTLFLHIHSVGPFLHILSLIPESVLFGRPFIECVLWVALSNIIGSAFLIWFWVCYDEYKLFVISRREKIIRTWPITILLYIGRFIFTYVMCTGHNLNQYKHSETSPDLKTIYIFFPLITLVVLAMFLPLATALLVSSQD